MLLYMKGTVSLKLFICLSILFAYVSCGFLGCINLYIHVCYALYIYHCINKKVLRQTGGGGGGGGKRVFNI